MLHTHTHTHTKAPIGQDGGGRVGWALKSGEEIGKRHGQSAAPLPRSFLPCNGARPIGGRTRIRPLSYELLVRFLLRGRSLFFPSLFFFFRWASFNPLHMAHLIWPLASLRAGLFASFAAIGSSLLCISQCAGVPEEELLTVFYLKMTPPSLAVAFR